MMTSSSEVREWKLPAGSLVKVGGIPYELTADTVVLGAMPPQQGVTGEADANRTSDTDLAEAFSGKGGSQ